MLPVLLFAAFWVVLGLLVFFLAMLRRGGARRQPSRGARRALAWTLFVTYVAFGVVIPVVFLVGNHSRASAQIGGIRLSAAEKRGRELFGEHCGVCHTLAAANAVGKVGPNLDTIQPTESLVLHTIKYGCLQSPPAHSQAACLGQGTMPADVVQGADAEDVAKFVAAVAGKE